MVQIFKRLTYQNQKSEVHCCFLLGLRNTGWLEWISQELELLQRHKWLIIMLKY